MSTDQVHGISGGAQKFPPLGGVVPGEQGFLTLAGVRKSRQTFCSIFILHNTHNERKMQQVETQDHTQEGRLANLRPSTRVVLGSAEGLRC